MHCDTTLLNIELVPVLEDEDEMKVKMKRLLAQLSQPVRDIHTLPFISDSGED